LADDVPHYRPGVPASDGKRAPRNRRRGKSSFYLGYLRLIHFAAGWLLLAAAIIHIAGLCHVEQ
jgi:Ni,Fe-hydrogenase I cytochrome b subunit